MLPDKDNLAARAGDTNTDAASVFAEEAAAGFADRLKFAMGHENVRSFAIRSGIPYSTLMKYVNGRSLPGADIALRLSLALDVTLDWLLSKRGPMRPGDIETSSASAAKAGTAVPPEDFRLIPRLPIQASAGGGALVQEEEPSESLAFRAEWLRRRGINAAAAHVLTAKGDSMEPTLRDGDILLVDTSIDSVVDNAIYVVVYAGRTLVKRVQLRRDGSVVLRSDNTAVFDEEAVPANEVPELIVAGRVMWYGRSI